MNGKQIFLTLSYPISNKNKIKFKIMIHVNLNLIGASNSQF